jgi:hypothetical protein
LILFIKLKQNNFNIQYYYSKSIQQVIMEQQTSKTTMDEFSEIQSYTIQNCKDEITKLLSGYNEGVLLWIIQHFFHSLHMKRLISAHINPVNILYTRNIQKQTPPGSYSKIVMMLSYQKDINEESYIEVALYLFNSAYELLRSLEY